MNVMTCKASMWGAVLAATLLALPVIASAQDTAGPVTCNDGSTSPHGGRGACSGHGGINKSASGAATTAAPAAARARGHARSSGGTVTCKDGTSSKGGQGACSGHGGVNKSAGAPARPRRSLECSGCPNEHERHHRRCGHGDV